ncbi:uncharacterized protein LOC112041889, partial [Lingula anatina]|uniref:Uncharacterized protein LOC112041889 n=1 Tax=Lingula anatina TaxID=7574 RepID=A0A2R2MMG0_LINAN
IPMGRKTNFWDLGVGPCGPNVEFYYDLVIFEETPFYAEKGGQDFDTGNIILNGVKSQVINVQFNNRNQILHKVKLNNKIKVGDEVILKIDKIKRDLTRKNHSSTHLLHSLLRSQISDQIKQNDFYDKSKVRVVKFDDFSIELCGGTHVLNTSEIESFRIIDFKTISKNIYRIYAITTYNQMN